MKRKITAAEWRACSELIDRYLTSARDRYFLGDSNPDEEERLRRIRNTARLWGIVNARRKPARAKARAS